MQFVGK